MRTKIIAHVAQHAYITFTGLRIVVYELKFTYLFGCQGEEPYCFHGQRLQLVDPVGGSYLRKFRLPNYVENMTEILCKWLNNDVKLSKKIGAFSSVDKAV